MAILDTIRAKNDLEEGKPVRVDLGGNPILIALVSGRVYAMDAVCSHEGGPLEDGSIEGYCLVCPWHRGIFDIRTAKASAETDWVTDLHSYAVIIDEKTGRISIDTDSGTPHLDDVPAAGQQAGIAADPVPPRPMKLQ